MDIGPQNLKQAEILYVKKLIPAPVVLILPRDNSTPDSRLNLVPLNIIALSINNFNVRDVEQDKKFIGYSFEKYDPAFGKTEMSMQLLGITAREIEKVQRQSPESHWVYPFTGWFTPVSGIWRNTPFSNMWYNDVVKDLTDKFPERRSFTLSGVATRYKNVITNVVIDRLNTLPSKMILDLYRI